MLGIFVRGNYNKNNPIRSYDLDEKLVGLAIDPSLTHEAVTRGYLTSEPSPQILR